MGSQRLPGKVLMEIAGRPTLDWVYRSVSMAIGVDNVVIACSDKIADDPIAKWARDHGINIIRGSEDDVLSRYMKVASNIDADAFVRITGDCPFIDTDVIGQVIRLHKIKQTEYTSCTEPPTFPDGLDTEVFSRNALEMANREAIRHSDRECVTRWMVRNQHRLPASTLIYPIPGLHKERWVLDSKQDFTFISEIADRLLKIGIHTPNYLQILDILDKEPWLRDIIAGLERNDRFNISRSTEVDTPSYKISKTCLDRAEYLIPLGSQTFSKSKLQFPEGVSPLFLSHGDRGFCYDVDGREYVDLVGGLLPNILGYRDPDVDQSIRDQLSRGISFSLATAMETALAERLNFHIPSAGMVRFGKNGSDVTTAAVRLARHITKRDKIMVGGYHGWHDWSMAVSEHRNGIPHSVQVLSGRLGGSNGKPAAMIIEPEFYSQKDLLDMRDQCTSEGIILVFDEIISGFRCGMGGLQKIHGITPDLSTFGKAMANGMPISALVGKKEFMQHMPEISYSGTFFGETLSIAASIATIDKLYQLKVPEYLHRI